MLRWAVIFLVVSLVAALFGFTGISAAAAGMAKILFYIFLILFLVALIGGLAFVQSQTGCAGTTTRESTGEYVDDSSITTKVKAAFVKDPVVKATDVKVETFKGTVQLSGFVDNAAEQARAADIARGVEGVKNVVNATTLKN